MNYFAHALPFLDDPYFVAGTGVPDWLSVVDRLCRVRRKHVEPLFPDADPEVAAVARGIVQHIDDDARFHETRAFAETSLGLSARCREHLGDQTGYRLAFLGHLLVEVLLDAALIAADPERLETYYRALGSVDPLAVQEVVNRVATRPTTRLAEMIEGFRRYRILSDYREDARLLLRLNQVMRRVGFEELPEDFLGVLAPLRQIVEVRKDELLVGIPT